MWFSALIVVVCVVEQRGLVSEWRNLVLLKASDRESAKARAIDVAARYRDEYRNGDGELVRWIPKAIETLDMFEADLSDGQEVYFEPREIEPPDTTVSLDVSFDLAVSPFGLTGSGVYPRR